jgi:hypothetical protein
VIDRRRVLAFALVGPAGLALMGHSPYRQWQVFRRSRLIIVSSAADPPSWEVAEAVAGLLATHLPETRALASRAADTAAIVSLLSSRQLDVGILGPSDATDALHGRGRFAEEGPVPLRGLARLGEYLFVCREDFPAANAWQIARALTERWGDIPAALLAGAAGPDPGAATPVPVHRAALEFYQGRPEPAASAR